MGKTPERIRDPHLVPRGREINGRYEGVGGVVDLTRGQGCEGECADGTVVCTCVDLA